MSVLIITVYFFNFQLVLIHSFFFVFIYFAAMDMKAVKDEIAEEEDDDVPGKWYIFNLVRESWLSVFFQCFLGLMR